MGAIRCTEGVWEGGHTVVTLDDKENFCGCGGRGHLEGIMGHRAMRLRFLDMEPEEVFEAAKNGRCALPGVQEAVAQGAGGGDGDFDPSARAGQVLPGGLQCAVRGYADAEGLPAADGEDESAAELLAGDRGGRRRRRG